MFRRHFSHQTPRRNGIDDDEEEDPEDETEKEMPSVCVKIPNGAGQVKKSKSITSKAKTNNRGKAVNNSNSRNNLKVDSKSGSLNGKSGEPVYTSNNGILHGPGVGSFQIANVVPHHHQDHNQIYPATLGMNAPFHAHSESLNSFTPFLHDRMVSFDHSLVSGDAYNFGYGNGNPLHHGNGRNSSINSVVDAAHLKTDNYYKALDAELQGMRRQFGWKANMSDMSALGIGTNSSNGGNLGNGIDRNGNKRETSRSSTENNQLKGVLLKAYANSLFPTGPNIPYG